MTLALEIGKRNPKEKPARIRKGGGFPAVFYGRKEASTPIIVQLSDFEKIWRQAGESTVIMLKNGGKTLSALIHDVQLDPISGKPIHADFYIVEADKEVEVDVPLEFVGIAPAVKELGGTLVKVLHEMRVRGLPKDLPHALEVEVSALKTLEDQVVVSEVVLPAGIEALTDPKEVVAAISVAKEEEEAPAEFDAEKVEVAEKGKKEEESEGGAEEGEKKE